jgi:hypothetical protein
MWLQYQSATFRHWKDRFVDYSVNEFLNVNSFLFLFIILFSYLDELCCLSCSHSELIMKLWTSQTVRRTLGRMISLVARPYLHTEQHKHRKNAGRHSCCEWDSNPRSQCSSGRRYFVRYSRHDRLESRRPLRNVTFGTEVTYYFHGLSWQS